MYATPPSTPFSEPASSPAPRPQPGNAGPQFASGSWDQLAGMGPPPGAGVPLSPSTLAWLTSRPQQQADAELASCQPAAGDWTRPAGASRWRACLSLSGLCADGSQQQAGTTQLPRISNGPSQQQQSAGRPPASHRSAGHVHAHPELSHTLANGASHTHAADR